MVLDEEQEKRELILLEQIEEDPDITQANLADRLGVAVGTVNWHIKRLINKGYIKAKRARRKKLRYIITPEGLALRAKLTVNYVENQMRLYRQTRQQVTSYLAELQQQGFSEVRIEGDGELAEVCQLTCLEQGFEVVDQQEAPVLRIKGYQVDLLSEGG